MTMQQDITDKTTAMTHVDEAAQEMLQTLEADWRRMCGNADTLPHQMLNPSRLDAALSNAFVLRRVAPGAARFRVAGQNIHSLMRLDPRGMPFSSMFTEEAREMIMEMMEAAFSLPAIVALPLRGRRGFGFKPVKATVILLPMRDAQGEMTRILGGIAISGPAPRKGMQFELDETVEMRMEALEGRYPDRRAGSRSPEAMRLREATQFREPRTVAAATVNQGEPAAPTNRQRGHLKLVVDNTV